MTWQNIKPYVLVVTAGLVAPLIWWILCWSHNFPLEKTGYIVFTAAAGGILVIFEASSWQTTGHLIGRGFGWIVFLFTVLAPMWMFFFMKEKPEQQQGKSIQAARQSGGKVVPATPLQLGLSSDDAQRWLLESFMKTDKFTTKAGIDAWKIFNQLSCTLDVLPKRGDHWAPLDLSGLPPEIKWRGRVTYGNDSGGFTQGVEKNLWLLDRSGAKRPTVIGVSGTQGEIRSDLRLLLEARKGIAADGDPRLSFRMMFQVEMPIEMAKTRLSLERRFGRRYRDGGKTVEPSFDLDKEVRVIDLPEKIDDIPVLWDISIRCYPLWFADETEKGRWMPVWRLSETHLRTKAPIVSIKTADGANVSGQDNPLIYSDAGELLSDAVHQESVEMMRERVRRYRLRQNLPQYDWRGGGTLYIYVPSFTDESIPLQDGKRDPIGVTVRVTIMLRTTGSQSRT